MSLIVTQTLILSLMVALMGRLFYLQIGAGAKYRDAALSIQSRDIVTPATRGLIVDSSGVPLALNRVGLAVTVDRSILDRQSDGGKAVLAKTAKLLGLKYANVYLRTRLCGEIPNSVQAGCWTGTRYQPIPITKDADPNKALQIVERADLYPGIDSMPVAVRNYPGKDGANAAHLLGYVGPLTESDLFGAGGSKYFRSESIGKAGLEYQYDKYLRGEPGIRTVIVDRQESVTRQAQNIPPIPGDHLVTSIDVRLQAATEKALAEAIAQARAKGNRGDSGAAVVMDVKTGRVLALASYPTYDPNIWEKGLTVKQAKDLFSESNGVPALSRVLQGLFAPASTFKSVSVVAAANAGYSMNATYSCPASVKVGNIDFQNFESKAQGTITMKEAIAISCDTIWYRIAYDEWLRDGGLSPRKNSHDYFFSAARGFQIGKKTGIDLPAESAGRLPDRQWRKAWFAENKNYYCNYTKRAPKSQQTTFLVALAKENCIDGDKIRGGDAVNFSIGQGDTVITPLKLTQMYAAIANGGKIWQPMVGEAIVTTQGKVITRISPKVLGTLPAKKSTLKFLQGALREVVISGTAGFVFAGFPVAISGKTGTAEVFGLNADGTKKDNTSWFASYGPSEKPRYAVVMMVSQGGFGSEVSGLGVRKIYNAIFGVVGNKVMPGKALFPSGPPTTLPRISPTMKVSSK
ncbi:MAG: penicillin-binding protein 2 [Candidatus Nanopelagicaceae bacterium]|nr:penicillin-binding protein 2 [Candidatus Nanopelagicaceae bacterium]